MVGLRGGYTYYPCLWGSRVDAQHHVQRLWTIRTEFGVGKQDVKCEPVAESASVLIPSLHIKLDIMKVFVGNPDENSEALQF